MGKSAERRLCILFEFVLGKKPLEVKNTTPSLGPVYRFYNIRELNEHLLFLFPFTPCSLSRFNCTKWKLYASDELSKKTFIMDDILGA